MRTYRIDPRHEIPASRAALLALALGMVAPLVAGASEPQDVSFVARCDGTTQRYVLLLPEGFDPSRAHPLLVAFHSYGGDRWQFLQRKYPTVGAALDTAAKWNMIYALPEYRGPTSWMGPKAETDVLQIIDDLKERYKVGKVFVAGTSMGGTAALTFTALSPGLVDGVVAMNALANLVEFDTSESLARTIQDSFGGSKAQVPLEFKRRSAESWPERFTMPLALTVGGKDTLLPPQSVMRFADAVRRRGGRVLLIRRENEGHGTTYEDALRAFDFVVTNALGWSQ